MAAVVGALVVLLPAMRLGLDANRLLEPSASVAALTATTTSLPSSPGDPGDEELAAAIARSGVSPAGVGAAYDLDAGARDQNPVAFGHGAFTAFHPSDYPRELILSFDDGPDLKFTPLVLDELDRRGLKAIFFVTGHRVVGERSEDLARRELLRKIAARGHLVGNHTMTHVNLCHQSAPVDLATEIDATAEVITGATGVRPILFRSPYGARCPSLEAALAARELVSVGWNVDPQDWRNPTSEEILAYVEDKLAHLRGRGILLLHDTHPASVFALGPLLDWIARENRRAVTERRPPIVLRDYSVFLPPRQVPATGIEAVAERMARGLPSFSPLALLSNRFARR